MSNERPHIPDDEDNGEFTDLFEDDGRNASRNLNEARLKAERKADGYDATARRVLKEDHSGADRPDIRDFSNTTEYSMKRLNPEVKLTSVEEDETTQVMDRAGYSRQALDSDGEDMQERRNSRVERHQTDRDEATQNTSYRRDIDYDYDAETTSHHYRGDEYYDDGYDDDRSGYDDYEDDYDEEEESSGHRTRGLAIAIVVMIVLLAVAAGLLLFGSRGGSDHSSQSSVEENLEEKQLDGVITNIDTKNKTMLVYNADTKVETSFSQFDSKVDLSGFEAGDIVTVKYTQDTSEESSTALLENAASSDATQATKGNLTVTSIRELSTATKLENVTGVTPTATQLVIEQKVYTVDDYLVCRYNGQPYDYRTIDKSTVFTAYAVDDHIYTIVVTSMESTITLSNLGDYKGGTIKITDASGKEITEIISSDTMTLSVGEGNVTIEVIYDGETVYTTRVFVNSGQDTKVSLPSQAEKTGEVGFSANVDDYTVSVDGQTVSAGSTVKLKYGTYTATASSTGYQDVTLNFKVSQPYQEVSINFERTTATVTITSEESGVNVYVDNTYVGMMDSSITVQLGAGSHTVVLTKEGYNTLSQSFTIDDSLASTTLYFSAMTPVEESSQESSESVPDSSSEETSTTPDSESSSSAPDSPGENSSDTESGDE